MKVLPGGRIFRQRCIIWSFRAVVCGTPSWFWATMGGYRQRSEIGAMIAAVATFAIGLAWLTSLPAYRERVEAHPIGRALRFAANVRTGIAALSVLLVTLLWLGAAPTLFQSLVGLLAMADMWTGYGAVVAVIELGRVFHCVTGPEVDSFGWTYLTALLQGGGISASMLLLSLVMWPWFAAIERKRGGIEVAERRRDEDLGVNGPV